LLGLLSLAQGPYIPGEHPRRQAPYLPVADVICDHFRNIARNSLLASSKLMFSLGQTARQILVSLRQEIKARDSQSSDLEALETKAGGLIYFYSNGSNNLVDN
jgi:hypothetical protein